MIIEKKRLKLREYTQQDFADLYQILSDPITMSHYPAPYDYKMTQRWIDWNLDNYQRYGFGLWAIELKENGIFIGDCGITMQNIDGELLPEIGYHINKDYWRQGFGKEAAKAVLDWGFSNTGFNCLYSYMTKSNVASYSTAKSIGMEKVKEYQLQGEEIHCVYVITKEKWLRENCNNN